MQVYSALQKKTSNTFQANHVPLENNHKPIIWSNLEDRTETISPNHKLGPVTAV
jgi:hypothetical protein